MFFVFLLYALHHFNTLFNILYSHSFGLRLVDQYQNIKRLRHLLLWPQIIGSDRRWRTGTKHRHQSMNSTEPASDNMSFCPQKADFTKLMRGLTCSYRETRGVTSTKRNFQNYHRGLRIKCEFLCTKCGIHSDHVRINPQPSRSRRCYQHQTQLLELSSAPAHQV